MTTHTSISHRFGFLGLILVVALLLSGCGQKGKLYLPDKASSHSQQQA